MQNNSYHINKIILGSASPRRRQLLQGLNLNFEVMVRSVEENFPLDMAPNAVAPFLSEVKSTAFNHDLLPNTLIITADTTVILGNEVINKPANFNEAKHMLTKLSGKAHQVVSGVTLLTHVSKTTFSETTSVHIAPLTEAEINFYLTKFKPYDKAGSYGIQEWFGYAKVSKINGCFYNVMGLPVAKLYDNLKCFELPQAQ